jgi:predicted amidohydrolase YtcJ
MTADTIYTGGDIVTINDAQPGAEAVAVKDGRIVGLGHRKDVARQHPSIRCFCCGPR